ncbi:MAG TPA: PilN domain-containing protein [Rhodopila sp.]|jgi:general secretion pathway protein L
MIVEFLTWWARQLQELVPASVRRRANGPPDACLISMSAATIQLNLRRAGIESTLSRSERNDIEDIRSALRKRHPIAISVSGDALLERTIVVPLAAERDLAELLRHEMESITPFNSDEVFWTWSVTRRDRDRRRLHVRLSCVPKIALPHLQAALDALGVAPSWLEAATQGGTARVIPLGHTAVSVRRQQRNQRLILAGTVGLAVAVIAAPFVRQSLALWHVDARIRLLEPDTKTAQTLRERIAKVSSAANLVAAEHQRVGDPLGVLSVVTNALPDDTFLTDLSIRQGKLEMTGQSRAAARLIGALSTSPTIRDPAFIASVTRAENGLDAFSIHADVTH